MNIIQHKQYEGIYLKKIQIFELKKQFIQDALRVAVFFDNIEVFISCLSFQDIVIDDIFQWYFNLFSIYDIEYKFKVEEFENQMRYYGEVLFFFLFDNKKKVDELYSFTDSYKEDCILEIIGNKIHAFEWELLYDKNIHHFLGSKSVIIRKAISNRGLKINTKNFLHKPNILFISSRVSEFDIDHLYLVYPIVGIIKNLEVDIEVLKSDNIESLTKILNMNLSFDIIHLDLHGKFLKFEQFETMKYMGIIDNVSYEKFDGYRYFLFFKSSKKNFIQLISISQLLNLLGKSKKSLIFVNACDSANSKYGLKNNLIYQMSINVYSQLIGAPRLSLVFLAR